MTFIVYTLLVLYSIVNKTDIHFDYNCNTNDNNNKNLMWTILDGRHNPHSKVLYKSWRKDQNQMKTFEIYAMFVWY